MFIQILKFKSIRHVHAACYICCHINIRMNEPEGQRNYYYEMINLIAKLSAGLYCTFTLANCRQIHTLLLLWQGPVMSRARRRKVGIVDYRLVRTVVGQLWTAPESCPRLFHDGTAGHP